MTCWICGGAANSAEHLVKASDIQLYFPKCSQKNTIYAHKSNNVNIQIGSKKSDHLKSSALICQKCNNERTQSYDKSWETLSDYIYTNNNHIQCANKIYLKKVFKKYANTKILYLHLYFLKLFGCLLYEGNSAKHKEICKEIANSILNCKFHPNVFYEIIKSPKYFFGISDLGTDNIETFLCRAQYCYCLGNIWIRVYYVHPDHYSNNLKEEWLPKEQSNKTIRLTEKLPKVTFPIEL